MSNKWQNKISFDIFCKVVQQNSEQLYTELFLQHENQFSIRNQRIAVKKLQRIMGSNYWRGGYINGKRIVLPSLW